MAIIYPMIAVGLGLTIWLGIRKKGPAFLLDVDASEVRLRDGKSGALLSSSPRGAVRMALGAHRISARGADFIYPVIALPLPGREDLSVGVYDSRFYWTSGAPDAAQARYLVSAPDWYALTEALGVRYLLGAREQ